MPLFLTLAPHGHQADQSQLSHQLREAAGLSDDQACFIFSRPEIAEACQTFATSSTKGEARLARDDTTILAFASSVKLFAVFFPAEKLSKIKPFWVFTGMGISSRLAEACLNHPTGPQVVQDGTAVELPISIAHAQIQGRIAALMQRAPLGPPRTQQVARDDVFLYPTGMAAIYGFHTSLCGHFHGSSVLFGFLFHSTLDLFKEIGPGYHLFGRGDRRELEELSTELRRRRDLALEPIQAVWTEFPANPLLTCADLVALRRLADEYSFVLVVDDTVSGFANVDVLSVADAVITSLAKSFSGYADVMGGGVILNPSSDKYTTLKALMTRNYHNEYCPQDATILEQNSRNYLDRSRTLNTNAAYIVDFLQKYAENPASTLVQVLYPTTNPDRAAYEAFLRPATAEFTPGYGCLFSVDFENLEAAVAFYDNLTVHIGPHLGAHLTLALAYTKALYSKQLDWAKAYGIKETQIRISIGLEDKETLKEVFRVAMQAADAQKAAPTAF